jgi:G3E family GTPase
MPDGVGRSDAPLPLHVLTGFLGSGKTTLLNRLLQSPRFSETAVLINEYGAVPIDHLLVREAREETVVLASGCVCCTLRTDLVEQLSMLLDQRARGELPPFKRVILETTGLADPAPIVQTVLKHPSLSDALYLDGIVCTVDVQLGENTLRAHPEAQKQIALADRLVLTKLDLVPEASLASLLPLLRRENPSAQIARSRGTPDDAQLLVDLGHLDTRTVLVAHNPGRLSAHAEAHAHLHDIKQLAVTLDKPVRFQNFSLWVAMLSQLWAERILRIKAVISAVGEPTPIAVQAVQHVVYPPLNLPAMPELQGKSHVVVLTRGLSSEQMSEIERNLRELAG